MQLWTVVLHTFWNWILLMSNSAQFKPETPPHWKHFSATVFATKKKEERVTQNSSFVLTQIAFYQERKKGIKLIVALRTTPLFYVTLNKWQEVVQDTSSIRLKVEWAEKGERAAPSLLVSILSREYRKYMHVTVTVVCAAVDRKVPRDVTWYPCWNTRDVHFSLTIWTRISFQTLIALEMIMAFPSLQGKIMGYTINVAVNLYACYVWVDVGSCAPQQPWLARLGEMLLIPLLWHATKQGGGGKRASHKAFFPTLQQPHSKSNSLAKKEMFCLFISNMKEIRVTDSV